MDEIAQKSSGEHPTTDASNLPLSPPEAMPAKAPARAKDVSSVSGESALLKILIVFGFAAIGITSSTTIRLSKPKYGSSELHFKDHDSGSQAHKQGKSEGAQAESHGEAEAGAHAEAGDKPATSEGNSAGHEHASNAKGHPPQPPKKDDKAITEKLEAIDTAIRAARFPDALKLCRELTRQASAEKAWHYREGLCLEAIERHRDAVKAYDKAADPDADPYLWSLATLGSVRARLALGEIDRAAPLLTRVEWRSGHPLCRDHAVLQECLFLRARMEVERFGPRASIDPLEIQAIGWASLKGGIENYLDWLPLQKDAQAPAVPLSSAAEKILVQKDQASPMLHSVTADRLDVNVLSLLKELASSSGLNLEVESKAEAALTRQVVSIEVEKMPLASLLTSLSEPLQLQWRILDQKLEIQLANEAPTRAQARDLVQIALERSASHPKNVAMRLTAPNLSFENGQLKEAVADYRRILAEHPHAPESSHAAYNLGLTALQLGESQFARVSFEQAIDRGLTDLGVWWIGRSHMEDGDPAKAIRYFRKVVNGKDRAVKSASVLAIATAHMLNADPEQAEGVLHRNRVLPDERHMALSSLFEAWLRYRKNPTAIRGENLLTCIEAAEHCERLGRAGVFVAGQAYRDLQQTNRMAALYKQHVGRVRGNLAVKMNFALAEHDWDNLQFDEASIHYKAIAAVDPDGYGPLAHHRLAQIALKNGKGGDCVAHCKQLLDRPDLDRDRVLVLMGRGYEKEGEYRLAAECFAGRVPQE